MKKYGVEIFFKHSKTIWKKYKAKNIRLKALILAGIAQKKPPLSSILAGVGVNTENFVTEFNKVTQNIFNSENVLLLLK